MSQPQADFFPLARKTVRHWQPKLVFDVGANIGQTATDIAGRFPEAKIHAFEPSPKSYRKLVDATASFPNVTTHNIALGSSAATLALTQRSDSTMNRLLPGAAEATPKTVMVEVRTGVELFHEVQATRIDFLKIDTEGHDYEVLMGFLPVIRQVDFIQVEAAMNPYNRTHVQFRQFEDLLWDQGFHLFHLFEQTMEWKRGKRPVLRRSNPVFINGRFADLTGIS